MQNLKSRTTLELINEDGKLDYSIVVLNALAEPIRIRILEYVSLNENATNADISKAIKQDSTLAEYHIGVLSQSKILLSQNQNQLNTYRIDEQLLAKVSVSVSHFLYQH